MYLRTTKRRNADGSTVQYFQLAENVWDPEKGHAVARVVHSFGRADELDRTALQRLAKSILRVFASEEALAAEPGVRILSAWHYGVVHVVESFWRELGIDRILRDQLAQARIRQPLERALLAMVTQRVHRPASKLACHEHWLPDEAFFPGAEGLALHHLYRALDFLEAHKETLEREVFFRTTDLFNVDVDLIFYDTTSLHFEIDEEDEVAEHGNKLAGAQRYEPLRRRGHSKNGRGDAPQIVVGLAVTRDGLPVRSWVFPGQTTDVTTVEQVKKDLQGWRLGRCVFVGDAGMNSEENRRTLALGAGKYILATRIRAGDEVSREVVTRAGRYQKVADNLQVKEVVVGDGERRRRYVVCFNPEEAERQRKHREKVLAALEEELATLRDPEPGEKHSKRACDLLTRPRYARYLRQTATGALRIDRAAIDQEAKLDGKWVVTSNDDTLTAEDMALGYKQLMRVEACWRTIKTGLRTRPIFHWTAHRICAHVSLCVLALLIERMAEIRARETWRNVAATLETIQVVEYERAGTKVRQTSEVRGAAAELLRRLQVAIPPKIHAVGPIEATEPAADA